MLKFLPIFLAFFSGILYSYSARVNPTWDCTDQQSRMVVKYYNEACTDNKDCFGHKMQCVDNKCQCIEDTVVEEKFVGEHGKQLVCETAPGLNEKCKTSCTRPLICDEKILQGEEVKTKICQCKAPYKIIDNDCALECQDDELYCFESLSCRKRCKENEMSFNETCMPIADLGGQCSEQAQCRTAFSECKQGTCACRDGFVNQNGLCEASSVNCPGGSGTVLMNDNSMPVKCELKYRGDGSSRELVDDCPQTYKCEKTYSQGNYYSTTGIGHCCREIPAKCLIGVPNAQFSCADNKCPWDTHYCYTAPGSRQAACCPRVCADSNSFMKDGKCYKRLELNDFCQVDEQCPSRAKCTNNRCKCSSEQNVAEKASLRYSYCSIECKDDEIMHDESCQKKLNLGESCQNQTWRCPNHAFCNVFNVCACSCPFFTLTENVCAPLPKCPGIKIPRIYMARSGLSMDKEMAQKGYVPISEEAKRDILKNVTFCTVRAKDPKIEAVSDCGQGKYCARYLHDWLGMCCRVPESVACPNGKVPKNKRTCTMDDALSCGTDEYCYDYLYTADPNSPHGKMCCPKQQEEE